MLAPFARVIVLMVEGGVNPLHAAPDLIGINATVEPDDVILQVLPPEKLAVAVDRLPDHKLDLMSSQPEVQASDAV